MILRSTPPEELPFLKASALLPYTQKHFKRLVKVEQDVCMIRYLSNSKRLDTVADLSNDFQDMGIKIEPMIEEIQVED